MLLVVGLSRDVEVMVRMERATIAFFRRFDSSGRLINVEGSNRCLNRNPGGENVQCGGHGLVFLYVALKA